MHESGSCPEGTKGAGDQEIKHNTRYPQHHTAPPHHTTPFAMSGEGSSSAAASGQQSMSSFLPGAPEHLLPPPPPPQLNTTTNVEAAKLTFPAEIPTAVKKAVLSFQPPPGRALHPIKPKKSQSVAVYYGVKLDGVKDLRRGGWRNSTTGCASRATTAASEAATPSSCKGIQQQEPRSTCRMSTKSKAWRQQRPSTGARQQ